MTDTIANRDTLNISKRARVLALAVRRMYRDTAAGRPYEVTPAELAIAEGVIAEVPEASAGDVALEHYHAQAARVEGELDAYVWARSDTGEARLIVSRSETVDMLAGLMGADPCEHIGEARMLLDVAAGMPVRCRGWIVSGAPIRG